MKEVKEGGCTFPDCPTQGVIETLKEISEKISDYKVFESDIRYIRETVDKLDIRMTKDADDLFRRIRIVESEKVGRTELFGAIGAMSVVSGIIFGIIMVVLR